MKFVKSKVLQKAEGRKRGKYLITLEVTDYDLEMFEDFATTYAPFEVVEEATRSNDFNGKYSADYKDKYKTWMFKTWSVFWKCWRDHDER